ncbi:MAG: hypothetical protein FWF35_03860 [Elusimicrobia bacterium]|nr:hypothetical protein [Elusimicrobiota bacterium]
MNKRPVIITVICIIGFIGALISAALIFTPAAKQVGGWYPPYLAAATVVGLVSLIGLWLMRKWSVILYTALFVVGQIVLVTKGLWGVGSLIIPLIIIAVCFANYKKMS